jgi:hypothetical protein
MSESTNRSVQDNPAMVDDFLEFGGGFSTSTGGQINVSSHKNGIQGGPTVWTEC